MNLLDHYDVIVIGGGPGGICAAAAAARQGASTLLVERYGFLGGMATAGLVNPFMSNKFPSHPLSTQIFNELLQRLKAENALCKDGLIFDDEILKIVLDEMMCDYGVDILFHSVFTDVTMSGSKIQKIHLHGKSGPIVVPGRMFIDSTGDGDVAAAAGAPFEIGREEDGACQPMTLCFRVSGISGDLHPSVLGHELSKLLFEAKKEGCINQPREDVLLFGTLTPGTYHFNTTRIIGKNGTSTFEITDAEIEGRRQAMELFKLFKARSPRFTNAGIVKMAAQIGVRETRRIIGKYTLTEEDLLSARKFEDGIARSNYPIDIHNPIGAGTILKDIPEDDYYEIPLRCLLPIGVENLIIGSRCICATHEAHSSLRIMPVVGCIGEAAGVSAVQAINENTIPMLLDGATLKGMVLDKSHFSKEKKGI